MKLQICGDKSDLGRRAALDGAALISQAIAVKGQANVIIGTGASQFELMQALTKHDDVDWGKVVFFHLDEYVGMPESHPASFRKYLKERLVDSLPRPPRAFHFINAEGDAQDECNRVGELIQHHPIDIAFVGIGENAHLAFNDPPADFKTEQPFTIVQLDEACRKQQLGEGWFARLEDVPIQAVSMSVRQILKSKSILCAVPDLRKADAIRNTVEGAITPYVPASILQTHLQTIIYLDPFSASRLRK